MNKRTEDIQPLWDDLADIPANLSDKAIDHLLSTLCTLLDAQNANWFAAVRLPSIVHDDPIQGWRPRFIHFLHQPPAINKALNEQIEQLETSRVDITTMANVAQAGRYRVNRLADLAPPEWFDGDYYHRYYLDIGFSDTIWAGCPVNEDAEIYIGVFRDLTQPRFTVAERDRLGIALRGLKWFHRQQLLNHGLLVARSPLTAAERKVLLALLSGQSEKQIASSLEQSYSTTHSHIKAIYRKFGVNNRAALMALWLGKAHLS